MKFSKLLLQAFGPFTDAALDFGGTAANLHLIYGPNEAGKSSALRAMTDLRFGIPTQSPDNFIHPFNQMRVAGVFVDDQGETVALVRRKGNKATLERLDPDTLQADASLLAQAGHELALTGGLKNRGEFEAMFGLNHLRLREGGDSLLKGKGELGEALFEASAGIGGIASILAQLDSDAKKLHNPHGAAKSAVINEAKKQLDEQRHALRAAQIKPAAWHDLYRAHEQAKTVLEDVDRELESQRRRDNELAELRTVAPLLREHDRVLAAFEGLAAAPDLPETAREQRLSAEQALQHAEQQGVEAESELARCEEFLESLVIEPALLAHAEFIERLAGGVKTMQRSREEARLQQIDLENAQTRLDEAAFRIGQSADILLRSVPSAADRVDLNGHVEAVGKLGERLALLRQGAEKLKQDLQAQHEDALTAPDAEARRALALALRQAQALGDVDRQIGDADRQIRELSGQIEQVLADLGLADLAALRGVRPLLDAEIAKARQVLADIAKREQTLQDNDEQVRPDLDKQQLELRRLSAAGEVVTADTLRVARARRDEQWQAVRRVYVENPSVTPTDEAVADVFESSQSEADRQADLLRADTKRAVEFEVCSTRIEQMQERRQEIAVERQALAERAAAHHAEWSQRLRQAGLPALSAEALHEWQARRLTALDLSQRLAEAEARREQWLSNRRTAVGALSAALQAVSEAAAESLPALLEQASAWEKAMTEAQAKQEERLKAVRRLTEDHKKTEHHIAEAKAELQTHHAALQTWHGRLFLAAEAAPEVVKTRLDELDALSRLADTLHDAESKLRSSLALVKDFAEQARQLADLLNEPTPPQPDDFAERLRQRLSQSKDAETQRKNLEKDRAKAANKQHQAQADQTRQREILQRLCLAAGVAELGQLPEQENLAAQKRQIREQLNTLRQQLAQASSHSEAELRLRLSERDTVSLDAERERCKAEIARLEQAQTAARQAEEQARRELEAIDASDQAARAREAMESAAARYRANLQPWARLRLAHALLSEALGRFRERAQAPMVGAASVYFKLMTGGRYERLVADDEDGKPVLRALREDGARIGVEAMSEGTADQLYLALRLAALELRRASHPMMPLVLDDVLITSDDARAANILKALAKFAEEGQVMLFTHHRHLLDLAGGVLDGEAVKLHRLEGA